MLQVAPLLAQLDPLCHMCRSSTPILPFEQHAAQVDMRLACVENRSPLLRGVVQRLLIDGSCLAELAHTPVQLAEASKRDDDNVGVSAGFASGDCLGEG